MLAAFIVCVNALGCLALGFLYHRYCRQVRKYEEHLALDRAITHAPGVRMEILHPRVLSDADLSIVIAGDFTAHVLDMDGGVTRTFHSTLEELTLPVTPGIAAAASVDGIDCVRLHLIAGDIDAVDIRLACGMHMAVSY